MEYLRQSIFQKFPWKVQRLHHHESWLRLHLSDWMPLGGLGEGHRRDSHLGSQGREIRAARQPGCPFSTHGPSLTWQQRRSSPNNYPKYIQIQHMSLQQIEQTQVSHVFICFCFPHSLLHHVLVLRPWWFQTMAWRLVSWWKPDVSLVSRIVFGIVLSICPDEVWLERSASTLLALKKVDTWPRRWSYAQCFNIKTNWCHEEVQQCIRLDSWLCRFEVNLLRDSTPVWLSSACSATGHNLSIVQWATVCSVALCSGPSFPSSRNDS